MHAAFSRGCPTADVPTSYLSVIVQGDVLTHLMLHVAYSNMRVTIDVKR